MNGLKKPQLLALGVAVVVIVLLVLAPRMPSGKQEEMAKMDPAKARTAEAVALVNGQEPMRGIKMLLEIVKEEPNNVEALWNLGLFSVKSGQYEKANFVVDGDGSVGMVCKRILDVMEKDKIQGKIMKF